MSVLDSWYKTNSKFKSKTRTSMEHSTFIRWACFVDRRSIPLKSALRMDCVKFHSKQLHALKLWAWTKERYRKDINTIWTIQKNYIRHIKQNRFHKIYASFELLPVSQGTNIYSWSSQYFHFYWMLWATNKMSWNCNLLLFGATLDIVRVLR